jgi:hypothetical protein
VVEDALRRKLDGVGLHLNLFDLAFVGGNLAAMKQQADWAMGNPGAEDQMLSLESHTEAWSGKLSRARELSKQAVESARRNDEKEAAALWQANAAIREALFGNAGSGREKAATANSYSSQEPRCGCTGSLGIFFLRRYSARPVTCR